MRSEVSVRRLRWSGAALFGISAVALAVSVAVLFPLQGSPDSSSDWFTATLTIAIGFVALASSGAGWWFLSGHRFGVGARLCVLAEALLLTGATIAFEQLPRWHEASPNAASLAVLPLLLLALAVCGAPLALVGVGALRKALAERRAADTSTIDGYLARLSVCLQTTPSLRGRILREAEDHLRIAATEIGEAKAIERFGTPEQLAEAFTTEARVASAYAVAWATLAAISLELAALLAATGYSMNRTVSLANSMLIGQPDTFWWNTGAGAHLESMSSTLSLVPPPLRGGLTVALALAALMALTSAVTAVATVRRRPPFAVICAATSVALSTLAIGLALALEVRLARFQVPLLPQVKWLALAIAGVLVAALWCAIELEIRTIRLRQTVLALGVAVFLPLLAGTCWRAPQPPGDGYWGWPPSPSLETGPFTLGAPLDDSPLAIGADAGEVAFAWVGWAQGLSDSRRTRARLCAYVSTASGIEPRRSSIAPAVANPMSIRALAVLPTRRGLALAWGTASGAWVRLGSSSPKPITAGRVEALQLFSLRGRPTLIAGVGGRLVMARAPRWQATPLVDTSGTLLSARSAGGGFALLTRGRSGLRFELRTASGGRGGSWSIPLRAVGGGVVGQLPGGRAAVAFAGASGGRYSLWLGVVRGGKLVRRLIASDRPCVKPLALGSGNGSAAVLTGSRCLALGQGSLFTASVVGTSEFISTHGSWQRYQIPDWVYEEGALFDDSPYLLSALSTHNGEDVLMVTGGASLVMP